MHRRSFLRRAAGASASICLAGRVLGAEPSAKSGVPFDASRLTDRNQNRSTVACSSGIVASEQPLASLAGVEILKAGGSAVDAAICANAMLALTAPMMCGPGGDLFAIVWSERDRKLFGLNASGRSPFDWKLEDARALGFDEIPVYSPLSWSVPGCVSGWGALGERFGKLPLGRLLEAPIHYAKEGFPVAPIVADSWGFDPAKYPTIAPTFAPDGKRPRFGEMFRNPGLAQVFEILSRDGADAFYEGEIAERIVKFSQAHGGRFSIRDFREHRADWIDPVSTSYRGYDVWELPPNGQGIAALQMLNMLETFDIGSLEPNSAEQLHLFIEAKKLAFEDRAAYYADMDFVRVPVTELISKEYAAQRAKRIDPKRAATQVSVGRFTDGSETTYLTAADADGNMVSLIQSIYHGWGSHYVPDGLGFCLQNRGQLFALDRQHPNCLEPHKRPFHTIIPAFMTRLGRPVFSFGVMGGDFQPQGHVQVVMNLVDFGLSPQQAGEQPRAQHSESSTPTGRKMTGGGLVGLEAGFPAAIRRQLAELGHEVQPGAGVFGGYQGIWREEDPRRYFGGSDPRKDGCAIGF